MSEQLDIVVTERGSKQVSRNIKEIGESATSTNRAIDLLKKTLEFAGLALGIRALIQQADAFTKIQNTLRPLTSNVGQLNALYGRLFEYSQRTGTALAQNVEEYEKLAQATSKLNYNHEQTVELFEQLRAAAALAGKTIENGGTGVVEFANALRLGQLGGRQMLAVLLQMPEVSDLLAKSLNTNIAGLKEMGERGQLSAGVLLNAFRKLGPELKERLQDRLPSIAGGFQRIQNAFTNFVGQGNQATGVGRALANVLNTVAANFDIVVAAALVFLAVLGANGLLRAVTGLFSAFTSLFSFLIGGFKALYGVVTTVLGAMLRFALFNPIFLTMLAVVGSLVGLYFLFKETIDNVIESMGGLRKIANTVINVLVSGVKTIINTWRLLPGALIDLVVQGVNGIIGIFEDFINLIIKAINKVFGEVISPVNFGRFTTKFAGYAKQIGEEFSKNFKEGADVDYVGVVKDQADNFYKKLKDLTNPQKLAGVGNLDFKAPGTNGSGFSLPFTQEQESQLDALLKRVDPAAAAVRELAEAEKLLNAAVAAGLVPAEKRQVYIEQLKFLMEDQIDPLGKVNRLIDEQTSVLKFNSEQMEVEKNLLQEIENLRRAGKKLSEDEISALRQKLTLQQQLNDAYSRQQAILNAVRDPLKNYTRDLEALNVLQQKGEVVGDDYVNQLRKIRIAYLETQRDTASGIERAFLKLEEDATNAAAASERIFTDAFNAAGDAIADFVSKGKINLDSLADIARNLAVQLLKLGSQQLFSGVGGLFGLGNSNSGGGFNLLKLFGFAGGGEFDVGPNTSPSIPGVDNRLVMFRARDGEHVSIDTPGQRSSRSPSINVTVYAADADSFKRSEGQIGARMIAMLNRHGARNN